MNPREELVDLARTAGMGKARAERFAEEVLATHAHELAEQQRTYAREVGVPLEDGDTVSAGDVIDLIDPQAGGSKPTLRLVGSGPCTATLQGWPLEVVDECVHEAGHYDGADPDSWHQAEPGPDGTVRKWSDTVKGATPHRASPARPDEEPTT